jgi:hypothetical protein
VGKGRSDLIIVLSQPEGGTMTTAVLAYLSEKRGALVVDWSLVGAACFGMALAAVALV